MVFFFVLFRIQQTTYVWILSSRSLRRSRSKHRFLIIFACNVPTLFRRVPILHFLDIDRCVFLFLKNYGECMKKYTFLFLRESKFKFTMWKCVRLFCQAIAAFFFNLFIYLFVFMNRALADRYERSRYNSVFTLQFFFFLFFLFLLFYQSLASSIEANQLYSNRVYFWINYRTIKAFTLWWN